MKAPVPLKSPTYLTAEWLNSLLALAVEAHDKITNMVPGNGEIQIQPNAKGITLIPAPVRGGDGTEVRAIGGARRISVLPSESEAATVQVVTSVRINETTMELVCVTQGLTIGFDADKKLTLLLDGIEIETAIEAIADCETA